MQTAARAGLPTHALLTDMNEVLGYSAGNALEIREVVAYLRGDAREPRLDEVVRALCAEMLLLTGIETAIAAAHDRVDAALASGAAAERFERMVAGLGGPANFLDTAGEQLPGAAVTRPVYPDTDGWLDSVDTRAVGNAVIELGGGRRALDDALDLATGFSDIVRIGSRVSANEPIATVHAASEDDAMRAATSYSAACRVTERRPDERPVICSIRRADESSANTSRPGAGPAGEAV
ncbi:MAG: hypothetical protein U5K76_11000 [Woeseiaceae bacterium]|nr:hypothetical protein [Woeseiaceae bacterium]